MRDNGVAFIDESEIHPIITSTDLNQSIENIKEIVSNLSPPKKNLHLVPISNIYSTKTSDGKDKLKNLINTVNDATGKEDLVTHLRMLSLQKVHSFYIFLKILLIIKRLQSTFINIFSFVFCTDCN